MGLILEINLFSQCSWMFVMALNLKTIHNLTAICITNFPRSNELYKYDVLKGEKTISRGLRRM